jgi:glycosyltransferase involved in cell wall biosynthesis
LTLQKFKPGDTIVYIRYPLADFLFLKFLRKNKVYKFVTEHQDIENTSIKGWMKVFEILWGKPVRRMITGFVGVTSEITDYERSYIKAENHHFITIGNGIDIQKYPLRVPTKERQNNEIRMLFVGGGHKHHGLARLIWSIYLYYKNINPILDVQLKIVGDSLEMVNSKNLVEKLKLTSRIKFLGNIKNENLNEIFNWADVGVASLGLHKIGLSKSSTLKTKEYFIRGLPFFWSSADDDFPNKYPYILQLKSEDSPFDLFQVISFVEKIKSKVNHPLEMRQYAIDNLDWSIKMKKLISFFDEILETNHK